MSYEYDEDINEGLQANPQLRDEYENTFSSEEKVQHALKLTKNNFTIDIGVVDFNTILVSEPIKNGRKETYSGLTTSVAEMGILSPIHVMVLEGYSDWLKSHDESEEDYEGYKYSILDGFRRVWAGYKNGLSRCYAVIWDFEDKDKGAELATSLSLILNKIQKRSWGEVWYLFQILEEQSAMTPGTLEYLLMLEPGDAMKLKDIMLCDYPEVRDELLGNKKNLTQCYNMLQKLRKEEDQLAKEDQQGISDLEQAEGIVEKGGDQVLSNEEVNEILEMGDIGDLSDSDFGGVFDEEDGVYDRQKVGDRHPLDPVLKAKTMERDHFTCQCCGFGEESGASRVVAMSVLQSHHVISVSNSGPDSESNIITICMLCHTLIHVSLRRGLKLGMTREEFDDMPSSEQNRYKKIMYYARKDWEAGKRLGKNKEQISEENKGYSKFKMPGTDFAENRKALETVS